MQPKIIMQALDRSGEKSSVGFYLADVTPANFDDAVGLMDDLESALEQISLCSWGGGSLISEVYTDVGSLPASPYAQRERRALFTCVDTVTGRRFTVGVPCPDMTDMGIPGTDAVNLTDTEVSAYVTALETFAASPEGNPLTVVSGKVVGVSN